MKIKEIGTLIFAFTGSMVFYSCEDEMSLITSDTVGSDNLARISYPQTDRMWYPELGDCYIPAFNCFPDVIVTPSFTGLSNAIDDGSVYLFFNSEEGIALAPYFPPEVYSHLVEGAYTAIKYDNEEVNKLFFFVGPVNELTLENAEIVIPVQY